MSLKTINQSPNVSDIILFNLYTDNTNPYMVNSVTIYFIERDYISSNLEEYSLDIQEFTSTFVYTNASPVKVYGTSDFPAWLSSDTANAFLTQVNFDEDDNPEMGHFQLQWNPSGNREGDYFLCYTWTPIAAGTTLSKLIHFYLAGNFDIPVTPSHRTNPKKYPTLLERYNFWDKMILPQL